MFETKLLFIVEVLVLGSLLFFVQPDFFVDIGEKDIRTGAMHASNWTIVEDCTSKIYTFISREGDGQRSEAILAIFLPAIAIHLYGRIWPVSDTVLSQFSLLIEQSAGVFNNLCYCGKPHFSNKVEAFYVDTSNSYKCPKGRISLCGPLHSLLNCRRSING